MWASEVPYSFRCLLDDADFLFRQAVEFVDELVDLLVGLLDLALDELLAMRGLRSQDSFMKVKHSLHEFVQECILRVSNGSQAKIHRLDLVVAESRRVQEVEQRRVQDAKQPWQLPRAAGHDVR